MTAIRPENHFNESNHKIVLQRPNPRKYHGLRWQMARQAKKLGKLKTEENKIDFASFATTELFSTALGNLKDVVYAKVSHQLTGK